MKILILDDDKIRHLLFKTNFVGHVLVHTYTAQEAIKALEEDLFEVAFLDHDLGGHSYVESEGEEETGYTVAKWLAEHPDRKPPIIHIHSYNPVGAQNMKNILPGSILSPGLWLNK